MPVCPGYWRRISDGGRIQPNQSFAIGTGVTTCGGAERAAVARGARLGVCGATPADGVGLGDVADFGVGGSDFGVGGSDGLSLSAGTGCEDAPPRPGGAA